ncbi:MAG: PKD domain-containing protein [bacterium]
MKKIGFLFILFFILCFRSQVFAVSGSIESDETWTFENSPYIVTGSVVVSESVILTIQPGVVVKFDPGTSLRIDGRLVARGTTDSTITFTSNSPSPANGDWGAISFTNTTMDAVYDTSTGNYLSGSIIENAVIEYGGSSSAAALLKIVSAQPFINNVTVQYSASTGIYVESGKAKIRNSTISNNGSYGIYVSQWGDYLDVQGCTISNNSSTGLYISNASGLARNNTISSNLGSGVGMNGSPGGNVTISDNLIRQNAEWGVWSSNGNYTIEKNFILSNSGGGVSAFNDYLRNNVIADNLSTAIYADWVSPDIIGNVIVNNISDVYTIYLQYYYGKTFDKNLIMSNVTKNSSGTKTLYLSKYSSSENPVLNNNNFINNVAEWTLKNTISSSSTIDAGDNWWDTPYDSAIQNLIYDYFDDDSLDVVDYTPFLTQPGTDAPISPPSGVMLDTSNQIPGQVSINWVANPESDASGYKVYWDSDGFPFDNVADAGNNNFYMITDVDSTVYIAVTAYDTGYSLPNDDTATIVNENQTNGNESWYSRLNKLPSVSLLASPSSGNVPLSVNLIATAQDNDGNIVSYLWDFNGDAAFETTTTSSSINYVYNTSGIFYPMVKVIDNAGGEATASAAVECNSPDYANQPPIITSIHSDYIMVAPGDKVRLFVTAFDPDYDSVSFYWYSTTGVGSFSNPGPSSPNCDWTAPMDTTGAISHQLICRVTDSKDAFTEGSVWIYMGYDVVSNQPPYDFYANASKLYGIKGGEEIALSASAYDPDYDTLSFSWTQRASDSTNALGTFSPGSIGTAVNWVAPVINAADVGGRYSVYFVLECQVDDQQGHTDWRQIYVEVLTQYDRVNIPPTVDLTFTPDFANAPVMIAFEANAADADGYITEYEWDFDGNGDYETTTTWRRMTYLYNTAGVYNARVRVTDDYNSTAVDSATVNVLSQNIAPTVTLTADTTYGTAPLPVHFTATAYDTDGTIMNYQWDFDGNSSYETTTTYNSIYHTFDSAGTYYVNVKVADNGGATATGNIFVMVSDQVETNLPPVITDIHSDITTVSPGGRVRVFASASDPDSDDISYRWYSPTAMGYFDNFSGDSTSCDWIAPLNPSGPASYELWCEATDGNGGLTQRSISIYMNYQTNYNNPPWVTIIPSKYQVNLDETITLTASASDPDGDPLTYEWGANNGVFNYTTTSVVDWTAPDYLTGVNIFVKVKDTRGGEARAEVFINVYSTLPPPPKENQSPIITDAHSDLNTVIPSGKVRLFASAYDPDYDSVNYNWRSASGAGYFANPGPNSASCDWHAPSNLSGPSNYELICEVTDGKGGFAQKSVWVYMNYGTDNYNKPPTGLTIISTKTYGIRANEEIYLYSFAYDPDGDPMTYTWRQEFADTAYVQLGTFTPATGSNVKWKAPLIRAWQVNNKRQAFFFIECRVEDGQGNFTDKRISVEVLTDTSNEPLITATPVSGDTPLTVDFTADANDPANVIKYEWDFDDNGSFDKITTANTVRNVYMKEGVYAAKVRVEHRSGGLVTSQPVTITVTAGPVVGNIDTSSPGSALRVDGFDLYVLSTVFGIDAQDQNWNQLADLDGNGIIDGNDLILLAVNFGRKL